MSLTSDEVAICNQALDRIGANKFTYASQTGVEALACIRHYVQTRDSLLRAFEWPFAKWRATLTAHTISPDFEWDYQCKLPEDYLRMRQNYTTDNSRELDNRYEIEGEWLLSNDSEVEIKYIRKVTDPNEFNDLFTDILILKLALKLVPALAGTKNTIKKEIEAELKPLISHAKTVYRQESNITGRSDWNNARFGSGTVV